MTHTGKWTHYTPVMELRHVVKMLQTSEKNQFIKNDLEIKSQKERVHGEARNSGFYKDYT